MNQFLVQAQDQANDLMGTVYTRERATKALQDLEQNVLVDTLTQVFITRAVLADELWRPAKSPNQYLIVECGISDGKASKLIAISDVLTFSVASRIPIGSLITPDRVSILLEVCHRLRRHAVQKDVAGFTRIVEFCDKAGSITEVRNQYRKTTAPIGNADVILSDDGRFSVTGKLYEGRTSEVLMDRLTQLFDLAQWEAQ